MFSIIVLYFVTGNSFAFVLVLRLCFAYSVKARMNSYFWITNDDNVNNVERVYGIIQYLDIVDIDEKNWMYRRQYCKEGRREKCQNLLRAGSICSNGSQCSAGERALTVSAWVNNLISSRQIVKVTVLDWRQQSDLRIFTVSCFNLL